MQATEVATTHPMAPYDVLTRPMRCNNEPVPGVKCTGRASDIDWNRPQTTGFRCPKCKAQNIVHIVAVAS